MSELKTLVAIGHAAERIDALEAQNAALVTTNEELRRVLKEARDFIAPHTDGKTVLISAEKGRLLSAIHHLLEES